MAKIIDESIITCSGCGLDFDEGDVNIIDYDLDLCIQCEKKYLKTMKDTCKVHRVHELKIHPEYFKEVICGKKTFEIRKNDRGYKIGDILLLKEFDPKTNEYTGKSTKQKITYISDYAQQANYVVMAIILAD